MNHLGLLTVDADPDDLPDPQYHVMVRATDGGGSARTDTAVAVVTFDEGKTGASVMSDSGETELIIMVVLSVLCGLLLILIIIMLCYIYRRYVYRVC